MANLKISEMLQLQEITGEELIPVVSKGVNKTIKTNLIKGIGYIYTKEKNSFAEGTNAFATGLNSHAEGWESIASGENSHAEGCLTEASGDNSHSEGRSTLASHKWSHAEGNQTIASEKAAHAEGKFTTASGIASHTEGINTQALNEGEHAEGKYNLSIQDFSQHTIGMGSGISGNEDERKNAVLVSNDGKVYINGIGEYVGTEKTELELEGKDLATAITQIISITYSELKTLQENSKLRFNVKYRIIDYECIINENNFYNDAPKIVPHYFDILITASSENTFYEDCLILPSYREEHIIYNNELYYKTINEKILKNPDGSYIYRSNYRYVKDNIIDDGISGFYGDKYRFYFIDKNKIKSYSQLEIIYSENLIDGSSEIQTKNISDLGYKLLLETYKWKIKYTLDNNSSKYEWTDCNGKGVIYYMKDDKNNEAPYDFISMKLYVDKNYIPLFFIDSLGKPLPDYAYTFEDSSYNNKITPYYEQGRQLLNRIININSKNASEYSIFHDNTFIHSYYIYISECEFNIFENVNNSYISKRSNYNNIKNSSIDMNEASGNNVEGSICTVFGDNNILNTAGTASYPIKLGIACNNNIINNSYGITMNQYCSNNQITNYEIEEDLIIELHCCNNIISNRSSGGMFDSAELIKENSSNNIIDLCSYFYVINGSNLNIKNASHMNFTEIINNTKFLGGDYRDINLTSSTIDLTSEDSKIAYIKTVDGVKQFKVIKEIDTLP